MSNSSSPFREAAFESRIKGFSNPISIQGSLSVSVMFAGILIAAIALCTYGYFTDYTRRATATGYLNPKSGAISISSPIDGQLIMEKQNGDTVTKGELIARVRNLNFDPAGQSVQALEIKNYEDGIALSNARLELVDNQAKALKNQREAAFVQFEEQSRTAHEQLKSFKSALADAQEQYSRTLGLSTKKLTTKAQLSAARQAVLNAQQDLTKAQSEVNELPNKKQQLELDWQSQALDLEQKKNNWERDLQTLKSELVQAKAKNEAGIFAPADGVLTVTQAQNDQFIAQGTPLFQVTPKSSKLVAVVLARSSAVGFVKIGDTAQIRYEAFPYRDYGVFEGKIIFMDDTAQLPSAINAPIKIDEPVYRVVLEVDQDPIAKNGKRLRLVSGMILEASIVIDKKPILFWLFDPVMDEK